LYHNYTASSSQNFAAVLMSLILLMFLYHRMIGPHACMARPRNRNLTMYPNHWLNQ